VLLARAYPGICDDQVFSIILIFLSIMFTQAVVEPVDEVEEIQVVVEEEGEVVAVAVAVGEDLVEVDVVVVVAAILTWVKEPRLGLFWGKIPCLKDLSPPLSPQRLTPLLDL